MSTGSGTGWNMPNKLTLLDTVPMFRGNGWGQPGTAAVIHAKISCCRYSGAKEIDKLIEKYKVTHFGGAAIVLSLIANADEKDKKEINHKVYVLTAGAPPTSAILEKMDNLGFEVMHVYGLTETYGIFFNARGMKNGSHNQNLKKLILKQDKVFVIQILKKFVSQIQRPMKKFQWMEKPWERF